MSYGIQEQEMHPDLGRSLGLGTRKLPGFSVAFAFSVH